MTSAAKDQEAGVPPTGWLNRNVVGMGLTSLLADAGYETATAILPGFLALLGAPPFALGLIEGVADATSSFMKLAAGWWGDRLGRRKAIVTAGYALSGTTIALFALAVSWPLILVARVLAWFGRGIRSPLRSALLAESVAPQDRGKAFGFHRAGDTIGAIVGPLLGAGLIHLLEPRAVEDPSTPFRIVFLLTLIPGLGSAVAFGLLVRDSGRAPTRPMRFWASVRSLPVPFRRFLAAAGVFGTGDFSATLLILAATQLLTPAYGLVAAAQMAAVLYTWRNVVYAAASYPVGHLSDRYGRRGLLAAGYVLGAVMSAGFALAFAGSNGGVALLVLLFTLAGAAIAVVDSLEGALTADLVPETSVRGLAYGVLGTVNGVGDFISSAVVGLLWSVNPLLGFGYAAALMLAGGILLGWIRGPRSEPEA